MGRLNILIHQLEDAQEDQAYFKQQLMANSGVLPSQLDGEDYYELIAINQAKPKDERAEDPMAMVNRLRGGNK
ncbi:hypothetical protein [Levilactobacillus brevis]